MKRKSIPLSKCLDQFCPNISATLKGCSLSLRTFGQAVATCFCYHVHAVYSLEYHIHPSGCNSIELRIICCTNQIHLPSSKSNKIPFSLSGRENTRLPAVSSNQQYPYIQATPHAKRSSSDQRALGVSSGIQRGFLQSILLLR